MTPDSRPLTVHIATDHAGLDLSHAIQDHLRGRGLAVRDHGPTAYDPDDDYPAFCFAAARAVVRDQRSGAASLGIVIGGSGNGEQIAANKVTGVRAALIWNISTAQLARQHNDANVAAIGARQHSVEECLVLVDEFVTTTYRGDERHRRRIAQIAAHETDPHHAGEP